MKDKCIQAIRRINNVILTIVITASLIANGSFCAIVYAADSETEASSTSTYEIKVGETTTLQAINDQSTWTTSNSKIATVTDQGSVTGISAGTAIVTEKTTTVNRIWFFWFWNWETISTKNYTIVVKDDESVIPETEDNDSKRIKAGEAITLFVSGSNVTWKSSDTTIAPVSSKGEVTGVKAGKATITATSVTGTSGGSWLRKILLWLGWGSSSSTVNEFKIIVEEEQLSIEPESNETGTEKSTEKESTETETEKATEKESTETETEKAVEEKTIEADIEKATEEKTTETETERVTEEKSIETETKKTTEEEASNPTESEGLVKPGKPTEIDNYYWNSSEKVLAVIDVNEADNIPTESELLKDFIDRGFGDTEIVYGYDMSGAYIDDTVVTSGSTNTSPVYETTYIAKSGDLWTIYAQNGEIFAYPAAYVVDTELEHEVLLSEKRTITSYDSETNKYYVTIPKESIVNVIVVEKINAETLDKFTFEEIEKYEK